MFNNKKMIFSSRFGANVITKGCEEKLKFCYRSKLGINLPNVQQFSRTYRAARPTVGSGKKKSSTRPYKLNGSNCRKMHSSASQGNGISNSSFEDSEWGLRCKLAVAYRIAAYNGWDEVIFNHITAKCPTDNPQEKLFLINPFGLGFDEVTASSLLKVDIEGNVVDAGNSSGLLFRQGYVIHSAVHNAREDAECVWHCHHPDVVAVSMLESGVLPLSQEALFVYDYMSYHPFEGSATDVDERERIVQSLGQANKVLMMDNHGPLTVGSSIEEAFRYMHYICRACEYQVKAMSMSGGETEKMRIPNDDCVEKMLERVKQSNQQGYDVQSLMFQRMVRKMEAIYGTDNIYC
uniref:Class II aldolase/adducin N-terminal domain-containing protein n=1 Tax=Aplanochytrium stocchinoi TaxID=215587 RepID=A0A7S3LTG9_9STRA|mmetsp:Transcript_32942/g.40461  ORF Transcript_32942/g.40461 Transcript_32942/m.40461 type:complete len:349 (+) Transcript_32942:63-1109(+)